MAADISWLQLIVMIAVLAALIWVAANVVRRLRGAPLSRPQAAAPQTLAPPPLPPGMQASPGSVRDYFVSHASQNAGEAKRLVAALEEAGLSCWIAPRNIKAGQAYGDAIGAAVARLTKATIVLVSAHSEQSDGVKSELELARRYQKPIVPVILDSHPPGKGMLYYVGTSHWLPFDNGSPETITALVEAVRD